MEGKNFIGGEWKPSKSSLTFSDVNPADIRDLIGEFPDSKVEDAKEAIDAAKDALKEWECTPTPERGKILLKASNLLDEEKEELTRLLTREEGKTLAESDAEVRRAIEIFRYFAGLGYRLKGESLPSSSRDTMIFTVREPMGIASIITPWNFPIAIPAWKIAPALVSGNTVVFKPSPLTPLMAQRLVEALEKAGLPKGVLNLVQGGAEIGRELVTNRNVDVVSFTGSYKTGKEIWRSCVKTDKMIRYQLEMGGKNPLVVMADTELDKAVKIAVKGAFGLTGQSCTATSRILVQKEVYDRFLAKLVNAASKIRVGNGLKGEKVDMGPAVSKQQLDKDLQYIEIGKKEGARLVFGGEKIEDGDLRFGFFIQPTIFTDVSNDMKIAREEIFGPIVVLMKFDDLDEAIEMANLTDYGLAAGICTNNLNDVLEFVKRVQAGVIKVNQPTVGLELQVPFGGYKKSSSMTFKEQGETAIEIFTKVKSIYISK